STDPPGLLSSSVFDYEGSYIAVNEILPGKGYWAKMSGAGKIIMSQSIATPKSSTMFAADLSRMNSLTLRDSKGHQQTLFFGMNDDIRSSLSRFDLPPPPPRGGFDVRFTSQRMLEVVENGESKEFLIDISSVEFPLTVTWNVSNQAVDASLTVD